jgi:hypothetical protein
MDKIAPYWKAVIGFVAPGATILISSVLEGSAGNEAITAGEWITALCTAVVTAGAVYAKANAPLDGSPVQRPPV